MDLVSILSFALVFTVAAISPGPAIAALVARVVGRGSAGVGWFCAGLVLGDIAWLACAAFGLAALAVAFQPLFVLIKYLGVAYLLWIAYKLWTAPATPPSEAELAKGDGPRAAFGALALALGNPKTMLFYVALLPTLLPLERLSPVDVAELTGVVAAVYTAVLAGYTMLALRVRRAFRSPRAMRIVNRTTGAIMAGAAGAIVARS